MATAHTIDSGPSLSGSLIDQLFHHSKTNPSHDAIVSPTYKISYYQLYHLVIHQVKQLENIGINNESIVGIKCKDDTRHLILCLAATYLGATTCTIPTHELEDAKNNIIKSCNVTDIIDENLSINPSVNFNSIELGSIKASEACLLFSTSGTTGNAKLVVHQDNDLVAQAHRHINSNNERFLCLASIEHNFAKRHRLYCIAVGATNIFLENDQHSLVAQCKSLNVNVIHVSAFQAQRLLGAIDIHLLSDIRLKLGGSHASSSLRQELKKNITDQLQAGYGTTETGAIAFTNPNDPDAGESVGQPLPGIEIRAVSKDRKPLPTGERGELAIRCKGMFRGYRGKPDITAKCLKDNWFYTGDIGYLDKQQRIYLCGRSDDMFVFNSMNIYPQDIESKIRQYKGIIDVAVIAKSSAVHGNIPVAILVFDKNVKIKLPPLKKYLQEKLGLRCPRQFIMAEKIPRNSAGKILRNEALNLSSKSDQVRKDIIQSLNKDVIGHLKNSFINAFENGESDISFREIEMDSISQMELLITLEVNYNTIITPQEFTKFRSFNQVVAKVLSLQQADLEKNTASDNIGLKLSTHIIANKSYVAAFFNRVFKFCPTVAQLNKALATFEYRLTPTEIENLYTSYNNQRLFPENTNEKFYLAFDLWITRVKNMMLSSGKSKAEPFISHRLGPNVRHFIGTGATNKKTLLICFSEAGGRSMMMPNAVLMQHTNAHLYDLLIISEPLNEGYRLGVPHLGKNPNEVIQSIANMNILNHYSRIRTLGCSAGCFPAVIAGKRLKADLAVSVGGRFHSERHPLKIIERIYSTWVAMRKKHSLSVLMCYDKNISRDKRYAKIIAWLSKGRLLAVELSNEKIGHFILQQLAEHGQLMPFLEKTIFINMDDTLLTNKTNVKLTLPENTLSPLN